MNGGTHPSLLFALGYGVLTALTPCVYPMIPITVSIFGAKAGVPRGARAGAGDRLRRGDRHDVRDAGDRPSGSWASAFGTFLANPWVIVPLALFFFAMAALDVRRLRGGAAVGRCRSGSRGSAAAASGGAFRMGLVGGIIAAPCTGPPLAALLAYVATTRNATWGFLLLATYGAGDRRAVLAAGRLFHVAAAPRALDGVGEERVRHRALRGRALLPQERRPPAGAASTGRRRASRSRWRRSCWWASALGAVHASFHGNAAERVRKALAVGLATRRASSRATNYVLAPKGDSSWPGCSDEPERGGGGARGGPPAAGRLRRQLVPPLPRVRGEGLLAPGRRRGHAALHAPARRRLPRGRRPRARRRQAQVRRRHPPRHPHPLLRRRVRRQDRHPRSRPTSSWPCWPARWRFR